MLNRNRPFLPSAIEYNIEVFTANSVKGWIVNKDNPQQTIAVLLFRRGGILASGLADIERPDVANVYHVPRSGFSLSFPDTNPRDLSLLAFAASQSKIERFDEGIYDYDLLCDKRWRGVDGHDRGLTWGVILEGSSFFEEIQKTIDIGHAKSIIEVGPGYGRLLKALIARGHKFTEFLGLDISPQKIQKLRDKIRDARVKFAVGDCRTVNLGSYGGFDLLISSSTFVHIRPDFGAALSQMRQFMKREGIFAFDVTDCGDDRDVQGLGNPLTPGGEFVGHYSKNRIKEIVRGSGLELLSLTSYDMRNEHYSAIIRSNPGQHLHRDGNVSWLGDKENVLLVHCYMVIAKNGRVG
jgi:SAM-dependent methyltransferase